MLSIFVVLTRPVMMLLKYVLKYLFKNANTPTEIKQAGADKYEEKKTEILISTVCALKARCNLRPLAAIFIGPGPER